MSATRLTDDGAYAWLGMDRPVVRTVAEVLHVGCRWPFNEGRCPCLIGAFAVEAALKAAGLVAAAEDRP